jgi:DNA-directed RNA polymerase subunit RPC12/RpoP/outer membrane protein assembly factor BamB
MTQIKKIQCPSCGSNSTYKLVDGNYKCNYCDSNFLVNEQQPVVQKSNNYTGEIPSNTLKQQPKIILAVVVGFILFLGIGIGSFLLSYSSPTDKIELLENDVTVPTIKLAQVFAGSKGAVIWIITEERTIKDSVFYELQIIDPLTKSSKNKIVLIPPIKLESNFEFNKKINSVFWKYNDLAYNISDDNGFAAYDIYTGDVILNSKILIEKHEELKSGILKIEHLPADNRFTVTTTIGDIFKFDPYSKTISTTLTSQERQEKVTSELYLSSGLKHQLYLFTKKGSGFPILMNKFVDESYINASKSSKGSNVKDIFGNINLEKIADKCYFRAHPMLKDNNGNLIILYKTDLTENASVMLESVNVKGATNWICRDSLLLKIPKAFGSEDLEAVFTQSDSMLIFILPTQDHHYVGLDINSGKKLWEFNAQHYVANVVKNSH